MAYRVSTVGESKIFVMTNLGNDKEESYQREYIKADLNYLGNIVVSTVMGAGDGRPFAFSRTTGIPYTEFRDGNDSDATFASAAAVITWFRDNTGFKTAGGAASTTAEGNRKGYIVLPRNFNFTTANLAQYNDYTIEVKYAFDLNSEVVNLPENSRLYFTGGSLSNFSELNGDNSTVDVIGGYKIFYYDRETQKIDGTWKHDEWNALWFGAIGDGYAVRGFYNTTTDVFTPGTNANTDFDLQFFGTDNFIAFQQMLDTAYLTNLKNAYIPVGYYKVSSPLNMGWSGYSTITLRGNRDYKIGDVTEQGTQANGTYLLIDHLTYGINVNGGYGCEIKDFSIYGYNAMTYRRMTTMWQNGVNTINFYPATIGDWNSNYVKDNTSSRDYGVGKYDPYIGVATDAFINHSTINGAYRKYTLPTPPVGVTFTGGNNSTKFKMSNVGVRGFSVGITMCLGNYSDNTDFYSLFNVNVIGGVYGITNGSNQARNTRFTDCSFSHVYAAITDDRVGGSLSSNGSAYYGIANNCTFDACYQIIDVLGTTAPFVFKNGYSENAWRLGNWNNYTTEAKGAELVIQESNFRFIMDANNPLGIPTTTFLGNNLVIENSRISNDHGLLMPIMSRHIVVKNSKVSVLDAEYSGEVSRIVDNTIMYPTLKSTDVDWLLDTYFLPNLGLYKNVFGAKKYFPSIFTGGDVNLNVNTGTMTFNSETGMFKMYYTGTTKKQVVGDIVGDHDGVNSYSVITAMGSDGGGSYLETRVINGYRIVNDGDGTYSYVLLNPMTTGNYDVIYKSLRWFDKPLRVLSYVNGVDSTVLTLEEWDATLAVNNKLITYFEDGIALDNNFFSTITAIDEGVKTITVANPLLYMRSGLIFGYSVPSASAYYDQLSSLKAKVLQTPIIADSGFDSDPAWTKGGGATVSGGVGNFFANDDYLDTSTSTIKTGKLYRVQADNSGTKQLWVNTWTQSLGTFSGATIDFYFYATTSGKFRIKATQAGTIDNLIITKID